MSRAGDGSRGASLIRTKLSPPVSRDRVPRPAALAALAGQSQPRLRLIRAPAGWGKSSLIGSWHAEQDGTRPFAWLALDDADNDPNGFFTYVIEALRSLAPEVGERSTAILRSPGADLVTDFLPVLLNELEALPGASVLVVDNYHVIKSAEIHEAVAFLLEHIPPELELVLSTRVEPPLPLARLQGRGELLELGLEELRFTTEEAAALLNGDQGLGLSANDIDRLVERTKGWPAGLYLAALSLRGRCDASAFIDEFAGDDRHLVDYLTKEVLAGQPEDLRNFLLKTSVLDRFDAALCDAVVDGANSAAVLREIEESNFFLVPLDTRRRWYRYHHLFAELLRHEFMLASPEALVDAHRNAAELLSERGETTEAIRHLVAAGDTSQAAELIAAVIVCDLKHRRTCDGSQLARHAA